MYKKLRDYLLFEYEFANTARDTGATAAELELYSLSAKAHVERAEKMLENDENAQEADRQTLEQSRMIANHIEESKVFLLSLEIC